MWWHDADSYVRLNTTDVLERQRGRNCCSVIHSIWRCENHVFCNLNFFVEDKKKVFDIWQPKIQGWGLLLYFVSGRYAMLFHMLLLVSPFPLKRSMRYLLLACLIIQDESLCSKFIHDHVCQVYPVILVLVYYHHWFWLSTLTSYSNRVSGIILELAVSLFSLSSV
jgi:hypothetical protein